LATPTLFQFGIERRKQLLPDGSVLTLQVAESSLRTIAVLLVGTITRIFHRKDGESFAEVPLDLLPGQRLTDAVLPHGAAWLSCFIVTPVDRGWNGHAVGVGLSGTDSFPLLGVHEVEAGWRVAGLLGPSIDPECILAIVTRPVPLPTDSRVLKEYYQVARIGRSVFEVLDVAVPPRFRVGRWTDV
jgi:hypothetical protein